MKKSEIISDVLSAMSEDTEIDIDTILSRKRCREIVDARSMIAHILTNEGFYPSEIAKIFKVSVRNIHYLISKFEDRIRCNPPMQRSYERITRHLRHKRK